MRGDDDDDDDSMGLSVTDLGSAYKGDNGNYIQRKALAR